jgi:TrmH family RNA methyltransferase
MKGLRSRSNPRIRRWQRLVRDSRMRRSEHRVVIEGAHLLAAYLAQGGRPLALLLSETGLRHAEIARLAQGVAIEPVLLPDSLFAAIADTETPTGIAAEIEIPVGEERLSESAGCIFMDGIQDSGNVGTIVRNAAAFGVRDVVLGQGCADPWSPKTLRAGMGGHFGLHIFEATDLSAMVDRFGGTILCTVARDGTPVHELDLRGRLGWIFGSEGRGVSEALVAKAAVRATIPMAQGAESLNVAAAAAICLYEARRQLSSGGAPS